MNFYLINHKSNLILLLDKMGLMNSAAAAKSLQSCRTLCNPIDGSPPGSPVRGDLQARTLEWVAIAFSNMCVEVVGNSHDHESLLN